MSHFFREKGIPVLPLKKLFEVIVDPLVTEETMNAWLKELRLVEIDVLEIYFFPFPFSSFRSPTVVCLHLLGTLLLQRLIPIK